ncbi:MAG: 2OG-Fe(II) oxygenase family protein [Colwellia polaris]|jgi:SM-20-related protein|tara:strand:- start:2684 stop:3376 length:693 start_codon:yes stop_codon:yes gene_type:complete
MTIKINDITNITELKNEFSENDIVRVFNFLEQTGLNELKISLETKVNFDNAFHLNGQNRQASDAEIKALPVTTQNQLYQDIHRLAASGAGFLYGRHKIEQGSIEQLSDFLAQLNSESTLKIIKEITSITDLTHADGQATRYRRGDFLTRHIDNIPGETRRIAYVLGFTEGWHPDWGGLLQFFEKDGTPTRSWSPAFNSLTLFNVDKVHSVTSVAQFAAKNRYSITGWFRA